MQTLLAALTVTLVSPEKADLYGLTAGNTILMVGPPGCGKTLMARVGAAEISRMSNQACRFAVVKPAGWEEPLVGKTQENIRNCFQALREAAKDGLAVLFLDEIEAAGRTRGSFVGHHSDKFLAALLAEIDGFEKCGNVVIVSATNRKELVDPALLDRISDIEIPVGRPDMRGAREIFSIHIPESTPFSPNGDAAKATREEIIDWAVSRLYAPNGDNELCVIEFADATTRTVYAPEVLSGRTIEQISRAARQAAFLRDVRNGDCGVRAEDIDRAISDMIRRLSSTLTLRNIRAYLSDLPQDIEVVSVEPIVRRIERSRRFLNVRRDP